MSQTNWFLLWLVGLFSNSSRLDKLSAKDDIEFYGSILDQIDNAME